MGHCGCLDKLKATKCIEYEQLANACSQISKYKDRFVHQPCSSLKSWGWACGQRENCNFRMWAWKVLLHTMLKEYLAHLLLGKASSLYKNHTHPRPTDSKQIMARMRWIVPKDYNYSYSSLLICWGIRRMPGSYFTAFTHGTPRRGHRFHTSLQGTFKSSNLVACRKVL